MGKGSLRGGQGSCDDKELNTYTRRFFVFVFVFCISREGRRVFIHLFI